MEVTHSPSEDALYVKLRDTEYARGKELDDARYLLLDADGHVLGISFLYVSEGVDLEGIPLDALREVTGVLQQYEIKIRSAA